MNKRHYTTADKPRVPTTRQQDSAIDILMSQSIGVKAENQRLKERLHRLTLAAERLLAECDRGPGRHPHWPGLDRAMGELRQESKSRRVRAACVSGAWPVVIC